MIRFVVAAVGLLSVAAPDAARQPVGMATASGRCTSLVMAGKQMPCGDALISIRYSDGRRSFAVKEGDGLVSFFGLPDQNGITLNLVTGVRSRVAGDTMSAASQPVTGRCTPAAITAKAEIHCAATAPDGSRYALTFVTDDRPPDDSSFAK